MGGALTGMAYGATGTAGFAFKRLPDGDVGCASAGFFGRLLSSSFCELALGRIRTTHWCHFVEESSVTWFIFTISTHPSCLPSCLLGQHIGNPSRRKLSGGT